MRQYFYVKFNSRMENFYNLDDLTICIPIRIDSSERMRNIKSVIRFYASMTNARFMIVESDDTRKFIYDEAFPSLDYKFIEDNSQIFHRTKILNLMLSKVETRFAGIWDSDAIAPVEQVYKAVKHLRTNPKLAIVYPFNGKFWNISNYFADKFSKALDIKLLSDFPQQKELLYGYHSVGGAFIVNVDVYKQYGWENEYFIGWGPEDSERYRRVEILGNPAFMVKGDLYHLDHPRGINSGNENSALSLSTRKEYAKVCAMERDELTEYIKTWPWIH